MFRFEPGKSLFSVDSYQLSNLWEFDADHSDANFYTMYTDDKQWRVELHASGGVALWRYQQDETGQWMEWGIAGPSIRTMIAHLLGAYVRGQGYFDNPKDWP